MEAPKRAQLEIAANIVKHLPINECAFRMLGELGYNLL